jgi:hypothetical protein
VTSKIRLVRLRSDLLTASKIDLALILLPLVGSREAARMLADAAVPLNIAARVLNPIGMRRRCKADAIQQLG